MTTPADLLAALDSVVAGGDGTATIFGVPPDLDGQQRMVAACAAELSENDLAEFLEEYQGPGWRTLIVIGIRHPELQRVADVVEGTDDVLLLAGSAGPIPPAALIVERSHGIADAPDVGAVTGDTI